ncbi:hypothetical protein LPU83_pLPU83c_0091 (plasmid) [Rhizobium favelukesii]|uniref:Uncharacterized protein n=1 Tax=Rhizobium favelukesii TaxID=348824 RepID=W6RP73_9HYPH|nr:hypothetical protein LPU83_pLPU83c_0091 [Rhizobium favelukesii]
MTLCEPPDSVKVPRLHLRISCTFLLFIAAFDLDDRGRPFFTEVVEGRHRLTGNNPVPSEFDESVKKRKLLMTESVSPSLIYILVTTTHI